VCDSRLQDPRVRAAVQRAARFSASPSYASDDVAQDGWVAVLTRPCPEGVHPAAHAFNLTRAVARHRRVSAQRSAARDGRYMLLNAGSGLDDPWETVDAHLDAKKLDSPEKQKRAAREYRRLEEDA